MQESDILADISFTYKEDHSILVQQIRQLGNIRENLELLNLHHCTENSLSSLVLQLQEIVKVIWPIPSHVIEAHMMSKEVLLQDLRSASISFLLAQNQLATTGRTPQFHKHLRACQEYLRHAFDIGMDTADCPSEIEHISKPPLPKAFFTNLQNYTDFLAAQSALECAKLSSASSEAEFIEQFDCVNEALNMLYAQVQNLSAFSHKPLHFQEETYSTAYQFCIHISYLKEQIPRLLELIKTFHLAYCSSPKRSQKISREIAYNLEAIIHSSRKVPPTFTELFKSSHVRRENRHHLRLIYSAKNE